VTGSVRILITNKYYGPGQIGDFPRVPPTPTPNPGESQGVPFNCAELESDSASLVGAVIAGGFTALNAGALGDVVTTFRFAYGTRTPTATLTPTRTRTPTLGPGTRTYTPTRTLTPTRTPTPVPPCP
jgi:hypothetical protein